MVVFFLSPTIGVWSWVLALGPGGVDRGRPWQLGLRAFGCPDSYGPLEAIRWLGSCHHACQVPITRPQLARVSGEQPATTA